MGMRRGVTSVNPNYSKEGFLTLEEYLLSAENIIKKFAPSPLITFMLKDEDIVSNIATEMMIADWRWNPDFKNNKNTVKSRRSYRIQCGIWAIHKFISYLRKQNKLGKVTSINYATEDRKAKLPSYQQECQEEVDKLLGNLNERDRYIMYEYFINERPMVEIAEDTSISKQRVHQIIHKGLDRLRSLT